MRPRTRVVLAWALWLVTFGCCAAGLLVTLAIYRPLTGDVAAVLTIVGVLLHWWSLPPAAVCVVLRFRSSPGVERQQLRWVAAGAAGAVVGLVLAVPGGLGLLPDVTSDIIYPALLCPPVAIGVAVLRYRLYDLDRIVSRTLGYGLLTVPLGLGYAGVVLGHGPAAGPRRPGRPPHRAAGRGRPDDAADPGLAMAPSRALAGCGPGVPVVGAMGYIRSRRRPAPDLLPGAHAAGPRR